MRDLFKDQIAQVCGTFHLKTSLDVDQTEFTGKGQKCYLSLSLSYLFSQSS